MRWMSVARGAGLLLVCGALTIEMGGAGAGPGAAAREGAVGERVASLRGGGTAAPAGRDLGRLVWVTRVVDGDTFVIDGGARVRVRNFDTPERRRYGCAEEKAAAEAATRAARALLHRQRVALSISGEDRYGRLIADVTIMRAGRESDFVARMVEGGHGARWDYGREPQPRWCPEPNWWSTEFF